MASESLWNTACVQGMSLVGLKYAGALSTTLELSDRSVLLIRLFPWAEAVCIAEGTRRTTENLVTFSGDLTDFMASLRDVAGDDQGTLTLTLTGRPDTEEAVIDENETHPWAVRRLESVARAWVETFVPG
jgi:hypothetical protein